MINGIHIDKEKALKTIIKTLKLDLNLNLDEIFLGTEKEILKGEWSEEYFNRVKNTKAAEYLYHYISASLATQFPYIPGSDKEAQGAIKIKRKTSNSQQLIDPEDEVDTSTKSINTSSYGLAAEEVNITMDNITQEYKIAWISDLHMMQPNEPNINTDWYTKHSTTFEKRNASFNNSYSILPKIIECLNGNDFDAIVFGGDIMDNYSEENFKYLKEQINRLMNKNIMFLVADHDYLTEMTTNSGANKEASNLGVSGDIKKITIGENGDAITLVGQNYSNEQISESSINTIGNYFSQADNSLFFTHVPIESKTQASEMQSWSRGVHNNQIYYWSKDASSSPYNNPSNDYLNTLYNSTSLKGVFAGHVHSSGDFELNTGIKEHIFQSSFNNSIGVITLTPSGNVGDRQGSESSNKTTAKDLTYIGYKKFQDMLKSTNKVEKERAMDYFSLDESWNLCVAKYYSEVENGSQTIYDIVEVKIPYRDMVSQYSVPFVFMMNLQLATHNANYVDAVADFISQGSEIELTIFDSVTIDETEYTYEATKNTKTKRENTAQNTMQTDTPDYDHSTSVVKQTTTTRKEIDTIKANVTKAKTWILEQQNNYELQTAKEYPLGKNGTTNSLPDESEPSGEGNWETGRTEHFYEEITKQEWVKSGDTKTNFNPLEFLGLWKNDTGKYVKGAKYNPRGKVVSYYIAGGELYDKPIETILSAEEQFYTYFEGNVSTQTHAELMKYVVNYYKGNIINISSLKSIFEPEEFIEGSYKGDFDVHDETIFITDLETLKKAFTGGYSGHQRLVEHAQAFLDMQDKYKVNALFAASVSITETSGGRAGHAVDGKNNWFNISKKGGGYQSYDNPDKSIMGFGWQIAEGGYYYKEGNYTVGTIGAIYCPNTPQNPTQADEWIENTKAQISRFYEAAGIDPTPYMNGGGTGGVSGAGGDGYRQKYRTGSGKEYVEYLQYSGPWKYNPYMGGNMKNSGCSVTSVAVILSGFGIDRNPEDVRRMGPGGISITGVLNSFGLKTHVINRPTTTQVLNHLSSGNPVIINAGNGYWSRSTGHYFPVLEAQGNQVYVANVGSSSKTGWYDIDKVLQDNKRVIFISK